MRAWLLAASLALLCVPSAAAQSDIAGAYADWGAALSRYVAGDHVQYTRWKAENPAEWRRFLAWLETADPSALPPAEQRAFWINAYNARVVAGVLAHYPIDSVKDVGYLGGRLRGFFGLREHLVAGRRRSLDEIGRIATTPPLGEPRAHFALTLAAEGGPPLRPEPYRGATLDTQLEFQTRTFLNGPAGHRLDASARRLHLTPILSWHADAFGKAAGSTRAFAGRYLMGDAAEAAANESWRIDWLPFDWRLNEDR